MNSLYKKWGERKNRKNFILDEQEDAVIRYINCDDEIEKIKFEKYLREPLNND